MVKSILFSDLYLKVCIIILNLMQEKQVTLCVVSRTESGDVPVGWPCF